MAEHIFGKDLSRTFYPLENNEPINLPSQVPSIYLFSTQPALDDALNGTGAIATHTVSYWAESATTPYPRTYTIPAIQDPDQSSSKRCIGYWEAVNYIAQTAGQTQTKLRYFEIERAKVQSDQPGTTLADIKAVFPGITSYATDSQLGDALTVATAKVKLEFEGKGFVWGQMQDLYKLKYAIAYKTIEIACAAQVAKGNLSKQWMVEYAHKEYNTILDAVQLRQDVDNDGFPDVNAPTTNSVVVNER